MLSANGCCCFSGCGQSVREPSFYNSSRSSTANGVRAGSVWSCCCCRRQQYSLHVVVAVNMHIYMCVRMYWCIYALN